MIETELQLQKLQGQEEYSKWQNTNQKEKWTRPVAAVGKLGETARPQGVLLANNEGWR